MVIFKVSSWQAGALSFLVVISGTMAETPAPTKAVPLMPNKLETSSASGNQEVAIILADNQFHPSKIKLRAGQPVKLLFVSVNSKSAALVMEPLGMQKWLSRERTPTSTNEINRELSCEKTTEIVIEPAPGNYSFRDPVSGAAGELVVEP